MSTCLAVTIARFGATCLTLLDEKSASSSAREILASRPRTTRYCISIIISFNISELQAILEHRRSVGPSLRATAGSHSVVTSVRF